MLIGRLFRCVLFADGFDVQLVMEHFRNVSVFLVVFLECEIPSSLVEQRKNSSSREKDRQSQREKQSLFNRHTDRERETKRGRDIQKERVRQTEMKRGERREGERMREIKKGGKKRGDRKRGERVIEGMYEGK